MKLVKLKDWMAGLGKYFTASGAARAQDRKENPQAATRRNFLKASGAAVAAPVVLTSRKSEAQLLDPTLLPPSPATIPWQETLPNAVTPLAKRDALYPVSMGPANLDAGECGRDAQQRWGDFYPTLELPEGGADLYELEVKENPNWVFNPAYPAQSVWGFANYGEAASSPGPTFVARYGRAVICRLRNQLPADHVGFGTPEISIHLHNGHTPSASDGFPGDYFSATKAGPTLTAPGQYRDHFYPNIYAGYDEMRAYDPNSIGDPRQGLGTLWYHDHTLDFTAPNTVRGLAGFYLLFDHIDSGDETDPSATALRLPGRTYADGSYHYDYPLIFQDKRFDASGKVYYDQLHPEGVLGDKVVVNGKIEPVLRVARRKYRLRLLAGGPSRFYEFYLVRPNNAVQTFTYIANDGNLLPAPLLNQTRVRLGIAERADIVVDFSRYPIGTELYLVNRMRQEKTRGPKDVKSPGTRVLKIIVDRNPPEPDVSVVPNVLRELPPLPSAEELEKLPVRRWVFERTNGMWAVNDRLFNVNSVRAKPKIGSAEIWELVNPEDGWHHPVHIHMEEGRILSKSVNGVNVPIPAHERGRKDVYILEEDMTIRVLQQFRDFTGKYPMHCHNTIHEDHAMMVRFDIED